MNRLKALTELRDIEFDILIIGGGIFGACAAREASARGLSVALIEKNDFASGSSSQHFKMIHGGIRYLQHGDLIRVRESILARRFFFRTVPHLVSPLPIVIPTYRDGTNRFVLGIGLFVYDILALDRNFGVDKIESKIPGGRILSRAKVIELFPGIDAEGLTGGVIFYDGQMYNSSRIVMSYLHDADLQGATLCNYLRGDKILEGNGQVKGVRATDVLTDENIVIKANTVLNAAGSWAHWIHNDSFSDRKFSLNFSRDACFLINKKLSSKNAIAVLGKTKDPDALVSRGARHLFIVPWRNYSLIGVWHSVKKDKPEEITITRCEIESFLDEVNSAYRGLNLSYEDITISNWGLTLFGDNKDDSENLSYGKRSVLSEHSQRGGPNGLFSLIGVRATTAGILAVNAINLIEKSLGNNVSERLFDSKSSWGGEEFSLEDVKNDLQLDHDEHDRVAESLYRNYGSSYEKVLEYAKSQPEYLMKIDCTNVIAAEVVHAVKNEMAVTLSDVVLRRTEVGSGERPSVTAIEQCVKIMANLLDWNSDQINDEVKLLKSSYPNING